MRRFVRLRPSLTAFHNNILPLRSIISHPLQSSSFSSKSSKSKSKSSTPANQEGSVPSSSEEQTIDDMTLAKWIVHLYSANPDPRSTEQKALDRAVEDNHNEVIQFLEDRMNVHHSRRRHRGMMALYTLPVPMRRNALKPKPYDSFEQHANDFPHPKDAWGDEIIPSVEACPPSEIKKGEDHKRKMMVHWDRTSERELDAVEEIELTKIDLLKETFTKFNEAQRKLQLKGEEGEGPITDEELKKSYKKANQRYARLERGPLDPELVGIDPQTTVARVRDRSVTRSTTDS